MFIILYIFGTIGFFLWVTRNTFYWVRLWQSREYRLDRLTVQIRETAQGKELVSSPLSIIKWALLVLFGLAIFLDQLTTPLEIAVLFLYVCEGALVLHELLSFHQFKRPTRTAKAYAIIVLTLLFIIVLYLLPMTDISLWLLLLDRLTVVVIAVFVFFFAFPTEIYTDITIQNARKKIAAQKNLLIIAVSGSYGKSSTKEYIAQVLSTAFHVVKTYGSNNTPIGIAKTVLANITPDTEIFVVEMGAYKLGEITQLCEITPPRISVTTSVSDQHLSLYGSLKNAINTEKELIDVIPRNGICLFNGNNSYSQELYKKTKKKKVLYSVASNHEKSSGDITATDIVVSPDTVSFRVALGEKAVGYKAPLRGAHMVENILPAIYLARYLKIPDSTIKKAIAVLTPPGKTMQKQILPNGVIVIDDTFNASPESVLSALAYLSVYHKKRFFILTPLIELGKNASARHEEIGEAIAKQCDYLLLTNKNFYHAIMEGVKKSKSTCVVKLLPPEMAAEEIITNAHKGDVLLFEGKEAATVMNKLL